MLTTGTGCPVGDKLNSITVGPRGPLLLQDNVFLDEMAHFDRERIPERVVHAKGAGAFGYFEVTHDITKYCKVISYKVHGFFNILKQCFDRQLYFLKLASKLQLLSGSAQLEANPDRLTLLVILEVLP